MSQAGSPRASGRGNPRWSVLVRFEDWSVQSARGIVSIAGLSESSAILCVGPPLFARPAGSSIGSVLFRLPTALNPHESSSEMLYPRSVLPTQLPPAALPATMVL